MRFIELSKEIVVNPDSIDYVRKNKKGFAVVHIGIEELVTSMPFESFLTLLNIGDPEKFKQFKFV